MLHDFLIANRAAIIELCREKVKGQWSLIATETELQEAIPLFFEQLIEALRAPGHVSVGMAKSAAEHGGDLLRRGFTVARVVRDYGNLCQAVTEVAEQKGVQISADDFHTFNKCLDDAIAAAVTEYTRLRDRGYEHRETERLGTLAHEIRNCLSAATLSFQIIQGGQVAVRGSTSAVLERSLRRMRGLLTRTLAAVRIDAGLLSLDRVSVCQFIEDIEVDSLLEATARGLKLTVVSCDPGVEVEADESLLASAVMNVVQNAFKYTRPGGHVWLRVLVVAENVVFEVEDECGGLPEGAVEGLFRLFEQRSADRSGVGLGLSIARMAISSSGGTIQVRDLPGRGCVFSIVMPRCAPRESAPPAPAEASGDRPPVGAQRVLIVDNEDDPAGALRDILALEGCEARSVHDGPAALASAPEFQPEVVLLDLGLPVMDGYEVARRLREVIGERPRLVACTGYPQDEARLKAAGFDGYLRKPFDMRALLGLLTRYRGDKVA